MIGTKYPIIQAGMGPYSTNNLCIAAAKAGALGLVSTVGMAYGIATPKEAANVFGRGTPKTILKRVATNVYNNLKDFPLFGLVKSFFDWQNILIVITFTVMMRIVMAVGGNILFRAVGIQFPLIVNIFTTTLMFIIFTLPISFGTLGVREGTYIVLFSLFGVESETALTVSFLALARLLLATFIGGIILLFSNIRQKKA